MTQERWALTRAVETALERRGPVLANDGFRLALVQLARRLDLCDVPSAD